MKTDIDIAHSISLLPIEDIAVKAGIHEDEYFCWGRFKAKVSLNVLKRVKQQKQGKLILVTTINPTSSGEGKTTVTIGLAQALTQLGKKTMLGIREPSMGPIMGKKGGATGGGYAQVLPMEDINLHFTGDMHAITSAHNLLASLLDNHIHHGDLFHIDPRFIVWPRVLDISDRALRKVVVGLGGPSDGVPHEVEFSITPASEIMAILCLSKDLNDLRNRLSRIIVAYTYDNKPVTAADLKAVGAMTVLLKEALKPNLLQTIEHTPAFIHTGAFASISLGNHSILADQIALKLNDYVVAESGFGSDLGMEKFCDIKCRYSGLQPDAAVIVATVRALKMHGGVGRVVAGKPLPMELTQENLAAVEKGCANLIKHIENAQLFGLPVVVA